ncbi:acetylornithine aminotransferase 1 [gamma proteobacterium HTCC5015]|nr:acetylornithine aminotransferase 1 [gamma proteobacterium HTCC5015]
MSALMQTYARLPVNFTHGEGATLWDEQGRRYIDALSGIAVCSLGHAHPNVTRAITDQAGKLLHTSNLYGIESQEQLGQTLCELSGLDTAFFCNSGAEANEAAIKIARRHGHAKGLASPKIVVFDGAFHGRTLATLTATANPKAKEGFGPLVEGFIRVPYGDAQAVAELAEQHSDIAAVFVEPVQGEGGVRVPPKGYLSDLRKLCNQHDWLLMLDEIQTGIGRTGEWFAFQHEDIAPDVMSLAKALGNGVPVGACLAGSKAAQLLQAGSHGTTFGGNPLACRAALAVIESIQEDQLLGKVQQQSQYMLQHFQHALEQQSGVVDIRACGLMIGIELAHPCAELVAQALHEHQLLINVTAGNTIRLLPPFVMTQEQIDFTVDAVISLTQQFLKAAA